MQTANFLVKSVFSIAFILYVLFNSVIIGIFLFSYFSILFSICLIRSSTIHLSFSFLLVIFILSLSRLIWLAISSSNIISFLFSIRILISRLPIDFFVLLFSLISIYRGFSLLNFSSRFGLFRISSGLNFLDFSSGLSLLDISSGLGFLDFNSGFSFQDFSSGLSLLDISSSFTLFDFSSIVLGSFNLLGIFLFGISSLLFGMFLSLIFDFIINSVFNSFVLVNFYSVVFLVVFLGIIFITSVFFVTLFLLLWPFNFIFVGWRLFEIKRGKIVCELVYLSREIQVNSWKKLKNQLCINVCIEVVLLVLFHLPL